MPVIAIIGAGPGLGRSIARRFGREGFTVALISRTAPKLDRLTAVGAVLAACSSAAAAPCCSPPAGRPP